MKDGSQAKTLKAAMKILKTAEKAHAMAKTEEESPGKKKIKESATNLIKKNTCHLNGRTLLQYLEELIIPKFGSKKSYLALLKRGYKY